MCTDSKIGDLSGFPRCAVSGHEPGNPQTTPIARSTGTDITDPESLDKSYETSNKGKWLFVRLI